MKRYDLALHQARHALDDQARGLDRLRAQAIVVLVLSTAAAVTTNQRASYVALVVVLAGFMAITAIRKFTFVQDPAMLVRWAEVDRADADPARDLALWMNKHHEANGAEILRLRWVYQVCLVTLAFQVAMIVVTRWP